MKFSEQSYKNGKTCAECITKRFENRVLSSVGNDDYYFKPFCKDCPHLKQFFLAPTEDICSGGGCCWCPWTEFCENQE